MRDTSELSNLVEDFLKKYVVSSLPAANYNEFVGEDVIPGGKSPLETDYERIILMFGEDGGVEDTADAYISLIRYTELYAGNVYEKNVEALRLLLEESIEQGKIGTSGRVTIQKGITPEVMGTMVGTVIVSNEDLYFIVFDPLHELEDDATFTNVLERYSLSDLEMLRLQDRFQEPPPYNVSLPANQKRDDIVQMAMVLPYVMLLGGTIHRDVHASDTGTPTYLLTTSLTRTVIKDTSISDDEL